MQGTVTHCAMHHAAVAQAALTAARALADAAVLPRALCLASAVEQRGHGRPCGRAALQVPWLATRSSPCGFPPLQKPVRLLGAAILGPRWEPVESPSLRACRKRGCCGRSGACPKPWAKPTSQSRIESTAFPLALPLPLATQVITLLGAGTGWAMPAALCAAGAVSGAAAAWRPERGVHDEGCALAEGCADVVARVPLRPRVGGGEPRAPEQRHAVDCSPMSMSMYSRLQP